MSTLLEDRDLQPMVIHLRPVVHMTDDEFFDFCRVNRDWRIERNAEGDVLIMPPAGGESGSRNAELITQLRVWAKRDSSGVAFDSSTGFRLPDTATRGPDAAWVRKTRLRTLAPEQKRKFLPLCPDFVVEQRSPSDRLSVLQEKMREYMENGAQLGWLIDPEEKQVFVYRPGARVRRLDYPQKLSGDPVLSGFVLDLSQVWDPGF